MTTARLAACLFASFILAFALPARADKITITAVFRGDNDTVPVVDVTINDRHGVAITVKAVLDTGNSNTTTISPALAAKLGVVTTSDADQKTGGGTVAVREGSLAGKSGGISGTGDLSSVPIPDKVAVNDNLSGEIMLLGGDFLKQFGDWDFNRKRGRIILTKDAEVADLNLHLQTPMTAVLADGTFVDTDPLGFAYTVPVSLFSGAGSLLDQPFVISTFSDSSLISMTVATDLGIDVSGLPSELINTYAGDILVKEATVSVGLFAGQPLVPITMGILSDSQNPLNENILGGDILSGYDEFDLDVLLGRFEAEAAVPVPEPFSLALLGSGLAMGLVRRRTRRQ